MLYYGFRAQGTQGNLHVSVKYKYVNVNQILDPFCIFR